VTGLSSDESAPPWYALYVKHRHEKKVAGTLSRKQLHTFLPTIPKTHSNGNRYDLPLFPGYVFCRLDVTATLPVLSTPGVFGIVSGGSTPGRIPEEEIESVRQLVSSGLALTPATYFEPGQPVEFNSGPLKGIRGSIVDAANDKWLIVSINILRRSVAVKLDRQHVVPCA
jgi:transcription antitermination factor NusG